jgi:PAS domain S-box-containing protein
VNLERKHSLLWSNILLSLLMAVIALTTAWAEGSRDYGSVRTPVSNEFLHALSAQERVWLHDHPVIRVAQDPSWPPIEFTDEHGKPAGMAADYLRLIEQRLGVKFEPVLNLSWQEAYARLKRRDIDMTTSVAVTSERSDFWAFTKPYMSIPIVIATSPDVTYIADMRELEGKKVAVVNGYAVNDWIPRDFPAIRLVRVKTVQEGLETLQRGEVFAFIESMLVLDYYRAKLELTTLKIAGRTPYVNAQSMAVRKDWAILAGILDKSLDSISGAERNAIYRKWLPIRYERGFNYARLWQTLAVFAVILLGLVLWIRKLAREIGHRKIAEAAASESEQRFRGFVENASDTILTLTPEGILTYVSPNSLDLMGIPAAEMVGKSFEPYVHPEDVHLCREFIERILKTGERRTSLDYRAFHRDGSIRWYSSKGSALRDSDGHVSGFLGIVRDITERKQAEAAVRASEESYQMLFREMQNGFAHNEIMCDSQGRPIDSRYLAINPAFERITGRMASDVVGKTILEVFPTLEPNWIETFGRVALTGEPAHFESSAAELGVCFEVSAFRPALNQYACTFSDITARKQALESLREREALLNEVGTVAKIGGWDMDLITRQARWTQGTYDIVEIDYANPIPGPDEHVQYYLPEYRPNVEAAMKNLVEQDIPLDFEAQLRTAKGHIKWVRAIGNAVRHEGRCVRAYGTLQDITARKQAAAAVRESEERFRTMVNSVPQLAWIARADGYIYWYNRRWYEYTGTTPEQMEGWGWQSVHDPKVLPKVMANWQGAIAAGRPFDMEFPLRGADGQFRTFLTRVQPFKNSDGVVMQWFGTNTDVDELEQAHARVRELNAGLEQRVAERTAELAIAKDRAEAADRTKSSFLATMSHELRTPLNSIIGFTGLMLQGLAGPLNAEQAKQLRMVKDSGQHLLALINDVLDISKIEAGQIEIANAPFDLGESVQKVVQTVTPLADKKRLPLVVRVAPEVGPITSDRRRVEQILLNLLSNAIKFTERGDITLTVEILPSAIRISVADTGIGMRREDMGKLFQPFRQLDTGLTRQHEGTGLGLAICKRLVERLGGTITVASEWSKGSTFRFTLPIEPEGTS